MKIVGPSPSKSCASAGLIYLRARAYDPKTAQFLSVDPLVELTRAPYTYASDNPLNKGDPAGLVALASSPCGTPSKHTEELEKLKTLKQRVTEENNEEREKLHEEEKAAAEDLLGKTLKVIGGCLAGSDVGVAIGGTIGFAVGDVPGAIAGVTVGGPIGCAVGGVGTALAPVNPLQPSEGGP